MNLDDKIMDIIYEYSAEELDIDEVSVAIKQAFAEAGYISPSEVAKWQKTVNVLAESFTTAIQLPTKQYIALDKKQQTMQDLMTGAEWYNKFLTEELNIHEEDIDNRLMLGRAYREAARRAAGLEEETK